MAGAERITVVVTTSPIPSCPSPVLLRLLFGSLRKHLPSIEASPRLLVCDGYARADGKARLVTPEAYSAYLAAAEVLAASGEFGAQCRILPLATCHGYGLALEAALAEVTTEFVLVMQHDWLFVADADICEVVTAMDQDNDVKYIGMQSFTTLDYARRMRVRYNLELPSPRSVAGLTLVPQLLWYDKPHLCRADHYREVVLPAAPMRPLECPEARFGLGLMWPELRAAGQATSTVSAAEAAERLFEAHRRYGTYFWDVGEEVIYHLSGRKLHATELGGGAGEGAPPPAFELRTAARASGTFTAAAAERTAHVAGLALPAKEATMSRFKGRCYVCGEKGHSKLNCAKRPAGVEEAGGFVEQLAGC